MDTRHIKYDELAKHSAENDCWIAIDGKVYDVTKFVSIHPGGKKHLLNVAGSDATNIFMTQHAGQTEEYRKKYEIGVLVKEGEDCPFTMLMKASAMAGQEMQQNKLRSRMSNASISSVESRRRSNASVFSTATSASYNSESSAQITTGKKEEYHKCLEEYVSFLKEGTRFIEFTTFFFQVLFRTSQRVEALFKHVRQDLLAPKFNRLMTELIGIFRLDKEAMHVFTSQLSLRHIQYNVDSSHVKPFGVCLQRCLKAFALKAGYRWTDTHHKAWKWLWGRVAKLFIINLDMSGPKVKLVKSSWERLIEFAHNQVQLAAPVKQKKKRDKNSV